MHTYSELTRSTLSLPTKSAMLAAVAVLALTAGGASAGNQHPAATFFGAKMVPLAEPCAHIGGCQYDQNSGGDGGAIDSQNFTSGSYASYNDAGADDFVVGPSGMVVSGIDVSGQYFNGTGPATSANVTFYTDVVVGGVHQPGAIVGSTYTNQATNEYVNGAGNFQIDLQVCKTNAKGKTRCKPKPIKLKGNRKLKTVTYWVSVVANCNFTGGCGEWGWDTRNPVTFNPAVWEGGSGWGGSCGPWTLLDDPSCLNWTDPNNGTQDDFMFDLF